MKVTGVEVSLSTVCRTLKCLGFSRKRLRYIAVQRSEERRVEFQEEIAYFNANMLVWTDECGSDRRNKVRKYGYNLRGMTSQLQFYQPWETFFCYTCCDNSWNRRCICH